MAKIDELYKEAMDNHFLHESTDLDTFKKILSEDNERRGYFNYVESVAKGFYGSYPSFSVQAIDMLNEKPVATQTAQSTEQKPERQEPELPNANTGNWQADLYNFTKREQIKAHQEQEQLRRERDASSNLTPEDVKAKAELDRKEEEAILANAPTWVNQLRGAKPTEDKTQIPMRPASFREEAGKDLPRYIVRKNDSERNVFLNIAEPWFANNEEGKAIWDKKERDVEVFESASKQEFEGYRSMLQQKVNSGNLSVEQAQKMLDDKAQQLENNLHSFREARENSAYQAAYDANKDRISWMLRQLGIDQTDNSVVDWKKRYSNKVRSSYDAYISAKESRLKAQEAYSVPGAAPDSGRRAALDEAWSKQNAAAHENNLYYLADRFIKKAEEVSAAVRDGKGFGAGFREGISDIANWDFGITDIAQSYNIYNLVKKNERWEKDHKPEDKLTDGEQALLDAASIYAMSQAYNADLLSRSYKAGQSSAASVPFMMQFAAMPIESIKNATARGLLQLTFRKGVTGVRRAARKHTGLFVGTLVATGVQTGTFGSGRIAADYYKGITGNIEAEFDKNGIVRYAGVDPESVKSRKTALKDAVAGQTIENFSEIYLSSLSPFAKVASTNALFKGINKSQIGVALRDLMNSSVGRAAKRAQWNGIIEEDVEEQLGNLLRWVSQSDYTYDIEGLKNAGFNLDDEIDTFLALAPTSIVFGSANVGGYYVPLAFNAAKLRMNMNTEAEKKMFDAIMRDSRSGNFGIAAHDKIRDVLTNKGISLEGKQAMIEAIFAKYHSEVYATTRRAVDDLAEEKYGKTFDGLGISNKYDNAIYSGVDQIGKRFFITDGHVATKNVDGETVIDTENSSKEFGIRYQKPDGTIMDEQKVPNDIAMGGIEQSTISNQRKLYVERGKSIILGLPTYTVDGETYSVETNQRLAPKEVEELKASTETPVVMDEDLPSGIAPIDTQARLISPSTSYRINQRDNSGKVVGYEDIKFSSSGHYLNSDGSINIYDENGEVDPQKLKLIGIWNERGQKVSGDNLVKYVLSLNETLRADRRAAIEEARKKESDAKAKADAAAAETNDKKEADRRKQEEIDKYVASVVGEKLPIKDGVISKNATPQQKFVWYYQNLGAEQALSAASRAVGESQYNLDKLEDDFTDAEEKDRLTAVANLRIKGYQEAVRNILGEQSEQQLMQDAAGYSAILLQRDMENAQEEERKRLERMAERQRIRQENRRKAGINLDNPENNSNIAQNSESNDNTVVQPINEEEATTSLPESTEGGFGEDQGNSGADNGAVDSSSDTDEVRSEVTAVDSLDNPNEQEEEQDEDQGEVQQQEPVDLTADDVVLMTSGAGTTRQTFVFAKKVTDESGNVTYVSLGNPYNKSVPAFGKVLRSNWGELDKSKKMFYVKDIDGNPIACYAFTKEDLSTKKFKPGAQLNAVVASSGETITAATSMPAAYVIGKNGEEVSILKGEANQDKRIRVESVKALLDYPIVIRYKSEAKGQDEIVFTLRDLLYSGKYKGDSHIISKDDEKKTVKRAHSHPYSVALEYLREESRKAFGADVAGAYTSEFNTQLRHLFEAWNAYCKEIGLTDITDKLDKLTQSDRDLFWSARAFIGGSNLDEADKASLTVSTDVDAKQMSEYLRANPLHQLAVMLYIGSKVAPQYVSGAEFSMLPGKSGEAGKGRVKNVQPMVTKDVIEKVRERYKALKAGKVSFNADSYVSDADEITNLERFYPEVLTDEPVHNRPRINQDNEKKVKQDIQNNKLQEEAAKKAAKEATKTDEEREADQYDILERTIEDGFAKLETALAEKNDEKVQEYTAQLNMLITGNEAAQQRLQDMLAEAMAQEVEHPVPVEPATPVVEEQPAAQEPEVTTEEPAAEPAPQAEVEVPAPEKRRKRNKKETPADKLRTMLENVRDLKRRMALGDREVTPSSIQEATDAIMDFISENGDTEELWNMYNAEFSVSPEQIATTERSRAIGDILLRMIGRIKGPKVHVLDTREDVEREREELRREQNGDTVEDLQTPEGIIYGFAIGDEIYITPEGLNADTPIHEFTHLWVKTLRANDRKLWKKIVKELKQNKSLWEAVTKDENYKHLTADDAIASEVLARFSGKKGAELLEQLAKGQKFGSERLEKAFINRAKRSVRTFWQWVAEKLFGWAGYKAKYGEETIDDFADMVLRDLFDGKELLTETERNAKEDERIQKEMADIKDKAIKDGTFMKAPNGQPSNLPERLWLLVRTENFKDWFGDWENDPLNASKVVDENGEPLVVYHGTNAAGFDRFRLDKDADARSGSQGFYNTDNRRVAAGYTRKAWNELPADAQEAILGADPHEAIYSLFANIRNPWRIDFSDENGNKRHWNEYPSGKWAVMGNEELGIEEGLFNSEEEANDYLAQFGSDEKPFQVMLSTDDFLRRASAAGFDGCIFTGVYDGNFTIGEDMTDYVALLPTQLKSVHNRGYFSTIDDRIEYSAAKSKAEYADAKVYVDAHNMMRDMIASLGDRKREISKKDEIGRIEKIIVKGLDRTESLRRMMECLNSYRKLNGLPPVDDKHDIRTLIDTSESRIENETDTITNGIAAEFTDAWRKLCDAIEKSNFYKDYAEEISPYGDTDARKRLVVHLTPLQLLERYLMAVDNIEERFDAKKERGLVELAQRLTGQHEDTEISREDALYYAIQFVEAFEHEFGSREASGNLVSDLWKKIKTMTDYALDKDYEGGNLSKEEYDELKAKKYYVPQRGNFHDEVESNTPNDTDLTRQGRSIKLDSMRKAEGGKSLGNAPIAHILRDAEEAITKCELNKVKIAMFDVLRENEAFAKANGIKTERVYFKRVEGEEKPVRVKESDADYVKATTEELNAQIKELEEEKKLAISDAEVEAIQAEIDNRTIQLNYSLTEDETHRLCMSEYNAGVSVPFIKDGVQQEISFPPRFQYIAYALNGVTDPRWRSEVFKMVMGWLSAQFTVNNIAFPIVNVTRDIAFVNTKGAAEYGIEFNARFMVNFVRCQRVVARYAFSKNSLWFGKVMSQQAEVGTERYLDEYPAAFREFLEAGANTGYSNLPSIHQFMAHVRDIAPGMKWREMSSEDKTKKVLRGVGKVVGVLELRPLANCINEWSELITRFAIYKSIIDMGLGKNEATKAAHNLSVNFNRKGFGGRIVNLINTLSVFANAALQGSSGYWRTFYKASDSGDDKKKHAMKAVASMVLFPALLGAIDAYMNPDDGEDDYVTEWDRFNYAIFGNIRIPLNEQLKPMWNLGVLAVLLAQNKITWGKALEQLATSIIRGWIPIAPNVADAIIDGKRSENMGVFMERLFMPTFLQSFSQIAHNENFMGGAIRYDFEKNLPQYMLAENEPWMFKELAYDLYKNGIFSIGAGRTDLSPDGKREIGSAYKGAEDNYEKLSTLIDVNPREIRQMLFFISRGSLEVINLLAAVTHDARVGNKFGTSFDISDVPILNRLYREPLPDAYRMNVRREGMDLYEELNGSVGSLKLAAKGNEAYKEMELSRGEEEAAQKSGKKVADIGREIEDNFGDKSMRGVTQESLRILLGALDKTNMRKRAKKLGLNEEVALGDWVKEEDPKTIEQLEKEERELCETIDFVVKTYRGLNPDVTNEGREEKERNNSIDELDKAFKKLNKE